MTDNFFDQFDEKPTEKPKAAANFFDQFDDAEPARVDSAPSAAGADEVADMIGVPRKVRAEPSLGEALLRNIPRLGQIGANVLRAPATIARAIGDALGIELGTLLLTSGVLTALEAPSRQMDSVMGDLDAIGYGRGNAEIKDAKEALNPFANRNRAKAAAEFGEAGNYDPLTIGERLGTIGDFIAYGTAGNVAEIAGAGLAPIPYTIGYADQVSSERAKNDGRSTATLADIAIGTGDSIVQTYLERLGLGRILPGGGVVAPGAAAVAGRVARETGVQSAIESGQEAIDYAASHLGTEKGATWTGAGDAALSGLLIGGPLGTVAQGAQEALRGDRFAGASREDLRNYVANPKTPQEERLTAAMELAQRGEWARKANTSMNFDAMAGRLRPNANADEPATGNHIPQPNPAPNAAPRETPQAVDIVGGVPATPADIQSDAAIVEAFRAQQAEGELGIPDAPADPIDALLARNLPPADELGAVIDALPPEVLQAAGEALGIPEFGALAPTESAAPLPTAPPPPVEVAASQTLSPLGEADGPVPQRPELDPLGLRGNDVPVPADVAGAAGGSAIEADGLPAELGQRAAAVPGELVGAQAGGLTTEKWTPRGGKETRANISDSKVEGSIGALSFEIRRDAEDRAPLQMWVTRDGKLTERAKAFTESGEQTNLWNDGTPEQKAQVLTLLRERGNHAIGSPERKAIDQQIADIVTGKASEVGTRASPYPADREGDAPVGAWVAGPAVPGLSAEQVMRQIQDVPLDRIDATEFDSAGNIAPEKRGDAERYTEAMRAGDQFPNGRASELPNGKIKLQDGHRRYAAAKASGAKTMRLAVSPMPAGAQAQGVAGNVSLGSISDIPFQQIGDLGIAGELTAGMVSPADWNGLRAAGLVQNATGEDGSPYEYVPAAALWDERERRSNEARSRARASVVSAEEQQQARERRARNDDWLTNIEADESRTGGDFDADRLGLRKAVDGLLGKSGLRVEYLRGYAGLPERLRQGVESRNAMGRKGQTAALYDTATQRVYVFTHVVRTPRLAAWNAAHEIAGHDGLRKLLGKRLDEVLELAAKNPTVAALAEEIAKQRKLTPSQRLLAVEEALAELAAAVRTGDYERITEKYQIAVPEGIRARIQQVVANFLRRLKELLQNRTGVVFKDADVRGLLEAAWQAANVTDSAISAPQAMESVEPSSNDQSGVEFTRGQEALQSRLAQWVDSLGSVGRRGIGLVPQESIEPSDDAGALRDAGAGATAEVQARRLIRTAKAGGFLLDNATVSDIARSAVETAGGSEHDVYVVGSGDNRLVIRNTANGNYGNRAGLTPADYLKRLDDYNRTFPALQMRVIGVSKDAKGRAVIWTAQPFVAGSEFATQAELQKAMEADGWTHDGYAGQPRFVHKATGTVIEDAHTGNILHRDGELFPIDVQIERMPQAMESVENQDVGLLDNDAGLLDNGIGLRDRRANKAEFTRYSRVKGVMYHATSADFDVFDTSKSDLGAHFGTQEQANQIAEGRLSYGNKPPAIMPVYLNITNPLRLKDDGSFHSEYIADQLVRKGILSKQDAKRIKDEGWRKNVENNAFIREKIEAAGYDGVVYKNTQETAGDSYIAFRPNQVKSATGNSGAFNPDSPSILESVEDVGETDLPGAAPRLGPDDVRRADRRDSADPSTMDAVRQDVADQLEGWRKMAKGRPRRPRSVLQRANAVRSALFDSVVSRARDIEARNPGSRSLRKLFNQVFTSPGDSRLVAEVMREDIEQRFARFTNRVRNILSNEGMERLTDAQNNALRAALLGTGRNTPPQIERVARRIRKLMDVARDDLIAAGVEVGEVSDIGYLTRLYDDAVILSDEAGFLAAAQTLYRDHEFAGEVGATARDTMYGDGTLARFLSHAKRAAVGDPAVASALEELKTVIGRYRNSSNTNAENREIMRIIDSIRESVAQSYAETSAAAWLHRIKTPSVSDVFNGVGPSGAPVTRERVLSGAADTVMADYLNTDVLDILDTYARVTAQKVAMAERFGPKGERVQGLMDAASREGVSKDDMDAAVELMQSALGNYNPMNPDLKGAVDFLHAWTYLGLLGRATFSSLSEGITFALRTGDFRHTVAPLIQAYRGITKSKYGKELRDLSLMIGLNGNKALEEVMQNQVGGDYGMEPKWGNLVQRFMSGIMLTQLTRAQRAYGVGAATGYLRGLSGKVLAGRDAAETRVYLNELGIADHRAFAEWLDGIGTLPTATDLFDADGRPNPMGRAYMTAVKRLVEQTIQNPNPSYRPSWMNSTGGRLFGAITGFAYASYENIIRREMVLTETLRREAGAKAQGKRLGVAVAGALALIAGQTATSILREVLFNAARFEDKDDEEIAKEMVLLGLSRTFGLGSADPLIQYMTGLKYQRGLGDTMLGASLGTASQRVDAVANVFSDRNSANTETAEYRAMEAIYTGAIVPVANAILSRLPFAPASAGGILAVSSRDAREKFAGLFFEKPEAETEADRKYAELRKAATEAEAKVVARMKGKPVDQWAAELEAMKAEYPVLEGVDLKMYKEDGKYGRAGEPRRAKDGKPVLGRISERAKYDDGDSDTQVHHIIPDNLVRFSPIMVRARKLGYDLDHKGNTIPMAEAKTDGEVFHKGDHPRYDARVLSALNKQERRLKRKYDSLDKAPKEAVLDAVRQVEVEMRERIQKQDVPVKDGRLAALNKTETAA